MFLDSLVHLTTDSAPYSVCTLLNSHDQQQPGDCDANKNLQSAWKVFASTLVLQGQGDGLRLDPLIEHIP